MQDTSVASIPLETRVPFLRKHFTTLMALSLLAGDVMALGVAFFGAHRLRRFLPLPDAVPADFPRFLSFATLFGLQLLAVVLALFLNRMYHGRRARVGGEELNRVFSSVTTGTLVSIALASFLFKGASFDYSRVMVIYAWVFAILLIVLFRWVLARFQRQLQARGYGRIRAIIVGSGEPAQGVLQRLSQNARLGYDIVGVVPYAAVGIPEPLPGVRVLGTVDSISSLIAQREADEVIVAVPEANDEDMLNIISRCDRNSISIKVYPDVFQIMAGQMSIGELGGLPLLNVRDVNLRGWNLTLKRLMDIAISGAFLVLASPFLVLMAIVIKLESPGPVFFIQERMGMDGKRFNVFKFRSMRADAERHATWTVKNDPRRTRLGSFLRAKNIDELPQFINVLIGDMSVVGPRPEQPRYVEEFRKRIPRYMERHREKSGITGWAQVNGLRGDTSIEERTQYDLWYIENWSFWLDIQIILRTLLITIFGRDENAY